MPNRLADETSPYLLQHAGNPVDWYPWGEEALQRARAEDKPIFLSIGYSACHWCHVMAHESFEDQETAAILNEHFVSIKVDREERPDLDRIYMNAVQALTGSGGWPMSVFLTPEGHPFYGGTYFPPAPRYGLPSFRQALLAIVRAWREHRRELVEDGRRMVALLRRQAAPAGGGEEVPLRPETLAEAFQNLRERFDPRHGGWGGAPKFPQPMVLEFLLRYHELTGEEGALAMVEQTLAAMARGGMYDQLGGGFHRYSVDERWLVPHFEKMLYDNAQLARVYLHAWEATGDPFYRTIAGEILDYVLREMSHPQGGFYSTQDADSEGVEGKFFVWTPAEIQAVLGEEAAAFMAAYGVTGAGNFEGRNVLELVGSLEEREDLAGARRRLLAAREERVRPGRDDKVLTSWNGLMLAALAEAARVLGRRDYREAAVGSADFLLRELRREDGRLDHTWNEGRSRFNGYLEDYTHLIEGLVELYQTTFEPRWYAAARELAEAMIAHFGHPEGGFYDTSSDHGPLVVRPREMQDNAVPSGNAMAAGVLLKLAGLAVEPRYKELAHDMLGPLQPLLGQYPLGFGQWLGALSYALSRPREIALVGRVESADMEALWEVCNEGYRPHQVIALGPAGSAEVPLLEGRDMLRGRATAYVCLDFNCQAPVTDPTLLRDTLAQG